MTRKQHDDTYSIGERLFWLLIDGRTPGMVEDDRRSRVRVLHRWSRVSEPAGQETLSHDELRQLWSRSRVARSWVTMGMWTMAALCVALIGVGMLTGASNTELVRRGLLASFWIGAATVSMRLMPRLAPEELRAQLLAMHRCPSCGQSLAGVEPQPDSCTVCPECGSAWRVGPRKPARTDGAP